MPSSGRSSVTRTYSAPAAACAADVLRVLARATGPLSLAQLERELGRSKSLIFRVLRELEQREVVARTDGGAFRLGIEAFELGAAYISQSDFIDVVRDALQALAEEAGETVNIGLLRGHDVLYVMKYAGASSYVTISRVGGRVPANCVALGKALLAELPEAELARRFHDPLPRMTPASVATLADLDDELATVRSLGYAIDEDQAALGRCGIAVTVRLPEPDGELAGLSISTTADSSPERRAYLLDLLRATRDRIDREREARHVFDRVGARDNRALAPAVEVG